MSSRFLSNVAIGKQSGKLSSSLVQASEVYDKIAHSKDIAKLNLESVEKKLDAGSKFFDLLATVSTGVETGEARIAASEATQTKMAEEAFYSSETPFLSPSTGEELSFDEFKASDMYSEFSSQFAPSVSNEEIMFKSVVGGFGDSPISFGDSASVTYSDLDVISRQIESKRIKDLMTDFYDMEDFETSAEWDKIDNLYNIVSKPSDRRENIGLED